MIEKIEIKNFTAFDELKIDFVPGVNLFIGENGTGKTHILKLGCPKRYKTFPNFWL